MAAKDVMAVLIAAGWDSMTETDEAASGNGSSQQAGWKLYCTSLHEHGSIYPGAGAGGANQPLTISVTLSSNQKVTLTPYNAESYKTFTSDAAWHVIGTLRHYFDWVTSAFTNYVPFTLTPATFNMAASGYKLTITQIDINIGTVTGAT